MSEEGYPNLGAVFVPPPLEIAKIAAVLSRDQTLSRRECVDRAIVLYLEAKIRHEELASLTLDEVIRELGDAALLDWIIEVATRPKTLRLYPDNAKLDAKTRSQYFQGGLDEVRRYLKEHVAYLDLGKTRSVLETIALLFFEQANNHDEGRRDFDAFMKRVAVRTKGTWQGAWADQSDCEGAVGASRAKQRHFKRGNVLYWELSETFLDGVIHFRKRLKQAGRSIRQLKRELNYTPQRIE